MSHPDFQVVETEKPSAPRAAKPAQREENSKLAEQVLHLILTTLSQRTVAIFSAIFTCLGLAACFWLWLAILTSPSELKLIGGTIFSAFLLMLEWVRRRPKGD